MQRRTSLKRNTAPKRNKPLPASSATIKKRSNKMEKDMRVYRRQRSETFRKNDECEARIKDVCLYAATDIQHKKGRGKFLLIKKYQIKVCRACHSHIEKHPEWAKDNDLAVSRLTE